MGLLYKGDKFVFIKIDFGKTNTIQTKAFQVLTGFL